MAYGSILNNISAISASRNLGITGQGMDRTIGRLTTGKRINQASDDAAGLAIANKLGADIRVAAQARRNAFDGVNMLQVADGVLDEVTNLLTRAIELTEQARTGTISNTNRQALNLEFQKISLAIADISAKTTFNGASVFTSAVTSVALASFSNQNITIGAMAGTFSGSISTAASAASVKAALDAALQAVSMQRASIGADIQNLNSYANSLGIQVENFTSAKSTIMDANIADEVVNLTKYQILNQSGTSALGQSNSAAQSILALLR
jgi:flagellin